jgi:hypothetical protein
MRKHLVATWDNPADQQPQQRRAGRCVWGWGWARAGELRGIPVREPRSSLCYQYTVQAAAIVALPDLALVLVPVVSCCLPVTRI